MHIWILKIKSKIKVNRVKINFKLKNMILNLFLQNL